VKQAPLTLPAEEPGTPLEPSGNRRPREMVTLDRIRLTGLLRKKPWKRGFFYLCLQPGKSASLPVTPSFGGFMEPLGAGARPFALRLCRLRPATRCEVSRPADLS
jgi:hypothetical protein